MERRKSGVQSEQLRNCFVFLCVPPIFIDSKIQSRLKVAGSQKFWPFSVFLLWKVSSCLGLRGATKTFSYHLIHHKLSFQMPPQELLASEAL